MSSLYVAVGLGGVAGTVARFAVSNWLHRPGVGFPGGTLLVNIAGSLVLGFVLRWAGLAEETAPTLRAALAVGFCGAFTTMSTFAFENLRLAQERQWSVALLYIAVTIVGCLAAVWLGYAIADQAS